MHKEELRKQKLRNKLIVHIYISPQTDKSEIINQASKQNFNSIETLTTAHQPQLPIRPS